MSAEALTYDEVVAILDERDEALVEKFAQIIADAVGAEPEEADQEEDTS